MNGGLCARLLVLGARVQTARVRNFHHGYVVYRIQDLPDKSQETDARHVGDGMLSHAVGVLGIAG